MWDPFSNKQIIELYIQVLLDYMANNVALIFQLVLQWFLTHGKQIEIASTQQKSEKVNDKIQLQKILSLLDSFKKKYL